MRKLDAYRKCLDVLLSADRHMAGASDIYRTGVVGQFNLAFELAWKAVKEALEFHGIALSMPGSPREVLKEGYAAGLVDDADIWLDMLQKRNRSVHIYDEEEVDRLVALIFDRYMGALVRLRDGLGKTAAGRLSGRQGNERT